MFAKATQNIKWAYLGLAGGAICMAAGFTVVAPHLYYQSQAAAGNSSSLQVITPAEPLKPEAISGVPASLHIPSLNMQLSIVDGAYNDTTRAWEVSNDKAHFATISAKPNDQSGNTYIYGHYRYEVFANLPNITPGAIVHIDTTNGLRFEYRYTGVTEVNPQEVSVLKQTEKPTLSLQTCSGFWYQNRQVFSFDFVSVKPLN